MTSCLEPVKCVIRAWCRRGTGARTSLVPELLVWGEATAFLLLAWKTPHPLCLPCRPISVSKPRCVLYYCFPVRPTPERCRLATKSAENKYTHSLLSDLSTFLSVLFILTHIRSLNTKATLLTNHSVNHQHQPSNNPAHHHYALLHKHHPGCGHFRHPGFCPH